tara:strand:- start:190 stop:483 length:294 start_codon:yes stop_codon:yes gene_type:complete
MCNEKIIINKDWLIKLNHRNIVLYKNEIAIIEDIKDYYDLLDALSNYLNNKNQKGHKCIRVYNSTNNASAVIHKKDFQIFYENIIRIKPLIDSICYQ